MELLIVCTILGAIVCPWIAAHKNRSVGGWFVIGLLFGLLGVLVIACIPALLGPGSHESPSREQRQPAPAGALTEAPYDAELVRQRQPAPSNSYPYRRDLDRRSYATALEQKAWREARMNRP